MGVGTVDLDDPAKRRQRGRHVAFAESELAERAQRAQMAGIDGQNPVPQPYGLFVPTPLRSAHRRGFECVDFGQSLLNVRHHVLPVATVFPAFKA